MITMFMCIIGIAYGSMAIFTSDFPIISGICAIIANMSVIAMFLYEGVKK